MSDSDDDWGDDDFQAAPTAKDMPSTTEPISISIHAEKGSENSSSSEFRMLENVSPAAHPSAATYEKRRVSLVSNTSNSIGWETKIGLDYGEFAISEYCSPDDLDVVEHCPQHIKVASDVPLETSIASVDADEFGISEDEEMKTADFDDRAPAFLIQNNSLKFAKGMDDDKGSEMPGDFPDNLDPVNLEHGTITSIDDSALESPLCVEVGGGADECPTVSSGGIRDLGDSTIRGAFSDGTISDDPTLESLDPLDNVIVSDLQSDNGFGFADFDNGGFVEEFHDDVDFEAADDEDWGDFDTVDNTTMDSLIPDQLTYTTIIHECQSPDDLATLPYGIFNKVFPSVLGDVVFEPTSAGYSSQTETLTSLSMLAKLKQLGKEDLTTVVCMEAIISQYESFGNPLLSSAGSQFMFSGSTAEQTLVSLGFSQSCLDSEPFFASKSSNARKSIVDDEAPDSEPVVSVVLGPTHDSTKTIEDESWEFISETTPKSSQKNLVDQDLFDLFSTDTTKNSNLNDRANSPTIDDIFASLSI